MNTINHNPRIEKGGKSEKEKNTTETCPETFLYTHQATPKANLDTPLISRYQPPANQQKIQNSPKNSNKNTKNLNFSNPPFLQIIYFISIKIILKQNIKM